MPCLAFYKAPGTAVDKLIRWATQSPYSHVELLPYEDHPSEIDSAVIAKSASFRDGGVRTKEMVLAPERWDVVPLPWHRDAETMYAVMRQAHGARYDLLGLLGSQVFNLRGHSKRRWFCSEFCAAALGYATPQRYAPG
jgi:hypothetical protein